MTPLPLTSLKIFCELEHSTIRSKKGWSLHINPVCALMFICNTSEEGDAYGQLVTCADLRKEMLSIMEERCWIGIPEVQILVPSLLLTLYHWSSFSISFLNTTAGGLKQMICTIFKPQILWAFFSYWGTDICWHIMDPGRMWKAAVNQYSKPHSFYRWRSPHVY